MQVGQVASVVARRVEVAQDSAQSRPRAMKPFFPFRCVLMLVMTAAGGCTDAAGGPLQGYVEGEFVFVASPGAGELEKLHVQRGGAVKPGDPLFALENTVERTAVERQEGLLARSELLLADERKGQRPSEIASLEAQLEQARAARQLSEIEFQRIEKLAPTGAASLNSLDRARASLQQDTQRVAQLEADLRTAKLGAREDRVAASEADVRTLKAQLERARWDLEQKQQAATAAGRVFDTLYREGEWVAAGMPVVVLLPPENVKVRTFVPEQQVGSVKVGATATVEVDGVATPLQGKVTFVSPRAEYTPPVVFSRESRAKLVFLVEIRFAPEIAATLHPGQPVDVRIEGV